MPDEQDIARRRPHPEAQRFRSGGFEIAGFLDDSDRPGHRRLWFAPGFYADFPTAAVRAVRDIGPDASPFPGETVTAVTLPAGTQYHLGRAHIVPPDDFDLDLRLGAAPEPADPRPPHSMVGCYSGIRLSCLSCQYCPPAMSRGMLGSCFRCFE